MGECLGRIYERPAEPHVISDKLIKTSSVASVGLTSAVDLAGRCNRGFRHFPDQADQSATGYQIAHVHCLPGGCFTD
jgi:hypothetical protein